MVVLRFEGEILVFPTSSQEAAYMLHELLVALADIGLFLDGSKTKVLTTQAQPPNKITTPCMLTACGSEQKKLGFAIPSPAGGKGVSCQQIDFGCFIGCVLCTPYHLPGTPTNPGHSFSKNYPEQDFGFEQYIPNIPPITA